MNLKIWAGVLILTASALPVWPQPKGEGEVRDAFIGTWKLQSFYLLDAENSAMQSAWCLDPHGFLIYTVQGAMSVAINCMDRSNPNFPSAEPSEMVFYAGTYEIAYRKRVVIHKVLNSSDISRVGQPQARRFHFDDQGRLTLTGKGKRGPVKLIWKKI